MKLSIILPIHNEEESLKELHQELTHELENLGCQYEIIAINDGSSDASATVLESLAMQDSNFRVVSLSKNYGQTAALAAGIDLSSGEIIMPMDADLQNDPQDIPRLLEVLEQGFDVVSGWRKKRKDNALRRIPSVIANKIISLITSVRLHDYGCTMKAYRREVIKGVRFYGEMHRFMPVYVAWHGARITELPVHHRARRFGETKYGISRTFRVILDLLTVKFLVTYLARPMHFFGWAGLSAFFFGLLSGIIAIVLRFNGIHFIRTPLPLLTVFLIAIGVQFILMGVLAEILIRIYHEPREKTTYTIRKKLNF